MSERTRVFFTTPRAFVAYHAFTVVHWLYFALLPYAGEWAHRERSHPKSDASEPRHAG